MSHGIDGSFINFALVKDVKGAANDGIIQDRGIDSEEEQRHISELERRVRAFDDEEMYVTLKSFIKYHIKTLAKILVYLEKKEGERK